MAFYSPDQFLDPNADLTIDFSQLPHWYQPGKFQFITFRLGDSLPQEVLHKIEYELSIFKRNYPEPWSEAIKKEYSILNRQYQQKALDKGYGECVLKHKECRDIVMEALSFYDEMECYDLVIMPNHVHILATCDEKPAVLLGKIKHYTAMKINRLLGRKGRLWQKDEWDRMIRNEKHLLNTRAYIYNNPQHLSPVSYTLMMGGRII